MPAAERWSEDQIAELERRWALGDSAGVIGGALGYTRNAVLGKVHRLGLSNRVTTVVKKRERKPREPRQRTMKPKPRARPRVRSRPKPPTIYVEPPKYTADCLNIPFLELEPHHCRFVSGRGEKGLATFCGHQTVTGESWCAFHCSIVYVSPEPEPQSAAVPESLREAA